MLTKSPKCRFIGREEKIRILNKCGDSRKERAMNNFFQKEPANNEEKINRIIEMLEAEAAYLRQLNEKLEKLSDEWQFIKKSMAQRLNKEMPENINSDDFDTEKEMEELILCIVKEVNNRHIEFISLN